MRHRFSLFVVILQPQTTAASGDLMLLCTLGKGPLPEFPFVQGPQKAAVIFLSFFFVPALTI